MAKTCAVVGGGFQGMIAAYLLTQKGFKVSLIEKAPVLGGIMHSWNWNGIYVDKGVHIFDSIPRNLGEIITDVMDGNVYPINFNYGSRYNGITTPGLAIPDLSHLDLPTRSRILYEVIEAASRPEPAAFESLYAKLLHMYGPTAAGLLDASMTHIYRIGTRDIEAESINQTAVHRLRFLDDPMSLELKKHPVLDNRIAAMRRVLGKVDDLVSLYPGGGGMKAFCDRMLDRLKKMGVSVLTENFVTRFDVVKDGVDIQLAKGEKLKAGHIFWAQDYATLAEAWTQNGKTYSLVHGTPSVLYFYMVPKDGVNDYTYFHQFTPGAIVFRACASGTYSRQFTADGQTYISVEAPTDVGTDQWNHPEKYSEGAFQECVDMGLLREGTPHGQEVKIMKAPVTYRLNRRGSAALFDEYDETIRKTGNRVIKPKRQAFTRREIMWAVEECVAAL